MNQSVLWIYLSPHFDDVALSCGGLVWEQVKQGDAVSVWTICGGSPLPGQAYSAFAQQLHTRWESGPEAVVVRRAEDTASCHVMGAAWRHFQWLDCIYRTGAAGQPLYASEQALWGGIHPEERPLIEQLAQTFCQEIPSEAQIVCPLALGDHVDHQLVRAAAEQTGRPLRYYPDYPYVVRPEPHKRLQELRAEGWQMQHYPVTSPGLSAWQDAVSAHRSQISTFWNSPLVMKQAMEAYWQAQGEGVTLLAPPPRSSQA
ncbi:MAG: PIG-L family deacetylase [Anaerolineales bacterium]|nr:PIG-L family deacetylase [Anaerolineales bacterium]